MLLGSTAAAAGVAAAGAGIHWLSGPPPSTRRAGERPNIILFVADDMRWDALGAAGNRVIETPALDRLAAHGTLFRNAFVTTSICPTSRASILLGQHARRHGVWDFETGLRPAQLAGSVPALLKESGYRTGFAGKWGLGGALPTSLFDWWRGFPGQGRYFNRRPDLERHLTREIAQQAAAFVKSAGTGRDPFFLQVAFKAPHGQDNTTPEFQYDRRFADRYRTAQILRPPNANAEAFARLPGCLKDSEGRKRWQRRFATDALFQRTVRSYYRLITGLDEAVGGILAALDPAVRANTVVIFMSDNGFFLGEHGLAGKWWMYEESIRIPLIVSAPAGRAAAPGVRTDILALNIDIAPTILDFAGIAAPAAMQGHSLAPCASGRKGSRRPAFYYEHRFGKARIAPSEGVRTDTWKLIQFDCGGHPVQLFNIVDDPHERRNLAADPAAAPVLARLRTQMAALRQAAA